MSIDDDAVFRMCGTSVPDTGSALQNFIGHMWDIFKLRNIEIESSLLIGKLLKKIFLKSTLRIC